MTITTHMCRGNFRSSWAASGGYDFVAEALFGELAVDGFFLEFDDERSGGFEPLRFVPQGKMVVLGLVTTKRGELESKDALKRRIERGRQVRRPRPALPVAAVRLLLHGRGQRRSPHDEQFAKLALIVETAAGGLGLIPAVAEHPRITPGQAGIPAWPGVPVRPGWRSR